MDDFRLSIRALRASPMVSLVAALSLALGIGANTAIFSLVNGLLLRALPVVEPQRLVTISSDKAIDLGFKAGLGWSYVMWDALRQRSQPFDGALAWTTQRFNLATGGEAQPVDGLVTSGDFFTVLGVKARLAAPSRPQTTCEAAGRMGRSSSSATGSGGGTTARRPTSSGRHWRSKVFRSLSWA
jgi:hypothetical protein